MNVEFYNFSKRKNSTKQPSSSGTQKSCVWKENTSIHNPTVQVAGAPDPSFTYAHISSWGKYYFVEDAVTISNGISEYTLREDCMASHKSEILANSVRVAFSTNLHYLNAVDPRITVLNTKKVLTSPAYANRTNMLSSSGVYVLTLFGYNGTDALGSASTYVLEQSSMNTVAAWLGDSNTMSALANYFNGNPIDFVMGCKWIPVSYSNVSGTDTNGHMFFGDQDIHDSHTITAKLITKNANYQGSKTITIPHRYTDFRASEPYTTGAIHLPGVGCVDLSMAQLVGKSSLLVNYYIDLVDGDILYRLQVGDDDTPSGFSTIQTVKSNVAVQCPLGQMTTNVSGAVSGIGGVGGGAVSMMLGAATGNLLAVAGGAAAMVASASSVALNMNRHGASISGGISGQTAMAEQSIYMIETSCDTQDPEDLSYITMRGRPYGEVVALSSCTGYVQCDGADVEISGSEEERNEINAILNEGFYIE